MNTIIPIISPNINNVKYGEGVNEVFDNINKNFEILSNHDFVKGDRGNSIYIETVDLLNNPSILEQLKNAVSSQYVTTPKPIGGISVMDFFENPGSISLIYEQEGDTNKLISSLPYTFKDMRFYNISSSPAEYNNEIDYSCIINYENGKFTAVQLFPTIYFDASLGSFCWIINGIKTGLEAQGPRGFDGKAGVFKNITVIKNDDEYNNIYKVSKILNGDDWIDVLNGDSGLDHAARCTANGLAEGTPVMAILEIDNNNNVYLSETYRDAAITTSENQMLVICNDMNRIFDVRPIPASTVENICNEVWSK